MEGGKAQDGGHAGRSVGDVGPSPGATSGGLPAGPAPQQQGERPARGSRRNKTVYKHVDLAALQQSETGGARNITPAEFRSQTNGIPPMAIRNSEYAPVTGQGQNMNRTFGNVFQSLSAQQRPKNFSKNEFAMKDDEFPSLK